MKGIYLNHETEATPHCRSSLRQLRLHPRLSGTRWGHILASSSRGQHAVCRVADWAQRRDSAAHGMDTWST